MLPAMPPNSEERQLVTVPTSANRSRLGLFPATSTTGWANSRSDADQVALQIPLSEGIVRDAEITRLPEA
jgi:hypothetical protein